MPNQGWYILKHFQMTCKNNPWIVTCHLLHARKPSNLTEIYWNLFVHYLILYPILCELATIFYQIQDFSPVSPLKIFSTICSQQYCFSHFLPVRMYFLSLFHFTVFWGFFCLFHSELFFSAAFFMLSVLFHSFLEQVRHMFHCLSSAPHQLFSLPHLYFIIFSPLSLPFIPPA